MDAHWKRQVSTATTWTAFEKGLNTKKTNESFPKSLIKIILKTRLSGPIRIINCPYLEASWSSILFVSWFSKLLENLKLFHTLLPDILPWRVMWSLAIWSRWSVSFAKAVVWWPWLCQRAWLSAVNNIELTLSLWDVVHDVDHHHHRDEHGEHDDHK